MNRRELLKYSGAAALGLDARVRAAAAFGPTVDPLLVTHAFLNQLGYQSAAAKQATIRFPQAAPIEGKRLEFVVKRSTDRSIVFRNHLAQPMADAASGDSVALADFSALRTPGSYFLEVDGSGSHPFPIQDDAYASALRLTMRAFYGQRCGCAVDLGDGYKYPACHASGAFHPSSGKSGSVANHGGWHDAGDYGRYVVNSAISTGTLLWAWELYPQSLRKLSLAIPESGGKLPDYLAEVRWNLEWMLGMQDADGGVWHKQTSEHFCGFIMPQDDTLTSYVVGTGGEPFKSTGATADLAAVMATAARCYGTYDSDFAQRCLTASRKAWNWALANPNVTFRNPSGVSTGGYGDGSLGDEIAWASAELWRTTGEAEYEKAFLQSLPVGTTPSLAAPGWGDVFPMACWTYCLAERSGTPGVKDRIRAATLGAAAALVERSRKNGYGNTLELREYVWGSNSIAANQSLLLLIAHHLHPDSGTREAALNNLHYLVGRNCFGISWVTQLGFRAFEHPHHRPSAADGIAAPWPGMLSGGPNAGGGDDVANRLPKLPPMRMWVDDERAYSLNEIAINWNAPLVFLLAGAD